MTIHREGYSTLYLSFFILLVLNAGLYLIIKENLTIRATTGFLSIVFMLLIIQFFRNPSRDFTKDDNLIIAPADGKIVAIEETIEKEYFKDKRIQVSIFMSPFNVHINRYPMSGRIRYLRYHPGKYRVAWHPKSSTRNERTSIVIERENKAIMLRQIAGALARRIVYYPHEGDMVKQGAELGFIKFGSRVDIFLPAGTKLNVKLHDTTRGGITVIAKW